MGVPFRGSLERPEGFVERAYRFTTRSSMTDTKQKEFVFFKSNPNVGPCSVYDVLVFSRHFQDDVNSKDG